MADILTHVTGEQLRYEPELEVYMGLVFESGFDPEMLWFPCDCLGAFDNQHADACWLGWIAYPMWMKEPTSEVAIITPDIQVDIETAHALAAFYDEAPDEDETAYLERHHFEPVSDVDERDEALREALREDAEMDALMAAEERSDDADVSGEHAERADDDDHRGS